MKDRKLRGIIGVWPVARGFLGVCLNPPPSSPIVLQGVLVCSMQLIFFICIFIEPKDPWYVPNFTIEGICLSLWILWVILVCVLKGAVPAGNWTQELLLTGSTPPTELLGQLRIQYPQCHSVLLVSNGRSPNPLSGDTLRYTTCHILHYFEP